MPKAVARSSTWLLAPALDWLKDALFPRRCLGCNKYGAWCCSACFASLTFRRQLTCPNCDAVSELGAFCHNCRNIRALAGLWSAQPYGNPLVRKMVRALKFDGLTELVPTLGELILATLRAHNLPPAWHQVPRERWYITPVPLHPRRARQRGFNQATLLGLYVAERATLTLAPVLKRLRHTGAQSELKDEERLTNVSRAFSLVDGAQIIGNAYILVDDVYTSGATLEECAQVLKAAGAAEVWGLTAAKG